QIEYQDGTPATVENYAKDVAAFLSWASDPTLNERKKIGWQVLIYLLITSVLLYIAKRRIWSGMKH
ncbi:MAG: cytochrome c1, partial [Hyphomicrobiaceae bacterium]